MIILFIFLIFMERNQSCHFQNAIFFKYNKKTGTSILHFNFPLLYSLSQFISFTFSLDCFFFINTKSLKKDLVLLILMTL